MKAIIEFPPGSYADLRRHLLPAGSRLEEAAFLLVSPRRSEAELTLSVVEADKLMPEDFEVQHSDFLELSDEARTRIIKRAHDLGLALVEVHSHTGPWPAAFSYSDVKGLRETVPHMWWRLKGRPYAAVVVTHNDFDALVWANNPRDPVTLDRILADGEVLRPNRNSLREWQ